MDLYPVREHTGLPGGCRMPNGRWLGEGAGWGAGGGGKSFAGWNANRGVLVKSGRSHWWGEDRGDDHRGGRQERSPEMEKTIMWTLCRGVTVRVGGVGGRRRAERECDEVPALPTIGVVVVGLPDAEKYHHGDQNHVSRAPYHFSFTRLVKLFCSSRLKWRSVFIQAVVAARAQRGRDSGRGESWSRLRRCEDLCKHRSAVADRQRGPSREEVHGIRSAFISVPPRWC